MTTEPTAYHVRIKEMPAGERPRERLRFYGAGALSNAELLAIALRTGTPTLSATGLANSLLSTFGSLSSLAQASVDELCQVSGIGPAKAAQVQAAIELGRRISLSSNDNQIQITSPGDAAQLLMAQMGNESQEQVRVLILDSKHRVQRMPVIYVGNVNSSTLRVAEVFRPAIKDNAPAILVAHNHPSGDPTPSPEDIAVTRALVKAGEILDIEVLDHLIIGRRQFVSLKERKLGFE